MLEAISANGAPKAIGPYSQGVMLQSDSKLVFVSGQLPVDPRTGVLIEGSVADLTHRIIDNIEAILTETGSGLRNVVKVEVFLTDMSDFSEMNQAYAKRFVGEVEPARQAVEVSGLPLGARLEISCVAVLLDAVEK